MPRSKTTTNHDEIRNFVESRGGHPATVRGTARGGEDAGLLRIDYPGYSGEDRLDEISWDDFFEKFEEAGLAFLYQDRTEGGDPSRFSKLVSRRNASRSRAARSPRRTAGTRGATAKRQRGRKSSTRRTRSSSGSRSGSRTRGSSASRRTIGSRSRRRSGTSSRTSKRR